MAKCVVCASSDSTLKRRLLYSSTSEHVIPVFRDLIQRRCPLSVDKLLPTSGTNVFSCRKYFRQAEKVLRLRQNLVQEQGELQAAVERAYAQETVVATCDLPPTGLETTPTRKRQRDSGEQEEDAGRRTKRRALDRDPAT